MRRRAAGPEPNLLAMIVFEKFGQHQPLNRQAERYAREGVPVSLSTLADQVGAACVALAPLLQQLQAHVLAAERLHGDDTTVPVLAKGKTDIARCWTYVRDDRPFGGPDPPAAMFYYSRDRGGAHPQGHLEGWQRDPASRRLRRIRRALQGRAQAGPILEAACWAHGRRKFSSLPTLKPPLDERHKARSLKPSIRSPWRRCGAWTSCSPSSATSRG